MMTRTARWALLLSRTAALGGLVGLAPALAFQVAPAAPSAPGAPPPPAMAPAPPSPPALFQAVGFGGSFLGIGVMEVDAERARTLNLRGEYGVLITRVETDSPAAKAGLQKDDVVLEYNGQRVEGTEQFVRLVRETPANREVRLLVSRGGAQQTLTARVSARQAHILRSNGSSIAVLAPGVEPFEFNWQPDIPRPFMSFRSSSLGIDAESVESQLAQYFGVKEGVLVRSVIAGSAAEKAGLKAGDVVTKVDATAVATPRALSAAMRALSGRRTFTLTATREKREMTFTVTLDDSNGAARPMRPRVTRVLQDQF